VFRLSSFANHSLTSEIRGSSTAAPHADLFTLKSKRLREPHSLAPSVAKEFGYHFSCHEILFRSEYIGDLYRVHHQDVAP
jgi:hypothetical protein